MFLPQHLVDLVDASQGLGETVSHPRLHLLVRTWRTGSLSDLHELHKPSRSRNFDLPSSHSLEGRH